MDVLTSDNDAIDVTCIVMTAHQSNEKSLQQNFSGSGENLDELFHNGDHNKAVNLFTEQYHKKLETIQQAINVNNLFILAFISCMKEIYIVNFKINVSHVKYISSGGFVKGPTGFKNIHVNGFINPEYGNVKLYKSKKRVELRLHSEILKSEYAFKIFSMPESTPSATP